MTPTFPACPDNLPKYLNPLRPSHYALLAYWVYFRPTALKCYLYQTIPGLFDQKQPIGFFRKWRTPAFRNLFIMMPVICLVISTILGGIMTVAVAWMLHLPVSLRRWPDGEMLGIALGMTLGMAFGMVGRVMGGVALSTLVGVTYGVTVGVLGGATFMVAFGVVFADVMDGILTIGAIAAMLGGMAFTIDLEIGIALSLAFSVIAALSFGTETFVQMLSGIRLGALIVRGMMSIAFVLGAFRVFLYPFEYLLALASVFEHAIHPICWDELTILPLPLTRRVLLRRLRENEQDGLRLLKATARNFFRRASLKAVLYKYLHRHSHPLQFLYELLQNPALDEYLLIPITSQDREEFLSVRQVFLGELALRSVDATKHPRFSRSVWWLNLRKRQSTPLTEFAGMLYDLSVAQHIGQEAIDLTAYMAIYSGVKSLPDGKEIARSYDAIAQFLMYRQLSDLFAAEQIGRELAGSVFFVDAIRPSVLQALARLGNVGGSLRRVPEMQGNVQEQLTILAGAISILNEIDELVATEAIPLELALLQRIVAQWQHVILEEIGKLGKADAALTVMEENRRIYESSCV